MPITSKNYFSTQVSDSFFIGKPYRLPERTVSGQGERLARRRYQKGQLLLLGKKEKCWFGRWYEDVLEFGRIRRIRRQEFLGTLKDYPTKRLASRELDARLGTINAPTYRARPTATFTQFADRWEADVISQFKPSTASNYKLHVRKHLKPFFGCYQLKDIGPEMVQRFVSVASQKAAPKTVRNLCVTLQSMWRSARAWHYVAHDVFDGVVLPRPRQAQRFFFSAEDVQKIISSAKEPRRTFYGLLAETGLRVGELCGLTIDDIDLERSVLIVRQSAWRGKLGSPKTAKSVRVVDLSPECVANVAAFLKLWRSNASRLLFASRNGTPWDANLMLKRHFKPLLRKAGINVPIGNGFHAFRHANETLMDRFGVPLKVRQERLGHTDCRMTLNVYTHVAGEDAKFAASQLGRVVWGRTFEISDVNGRKIKTA